MSAPTAADTTPEWRSCSDLKIWRSEAADNFRFMSFQRAAAMGGLFDVRFGVPFIYVDAALIGASAIC
jgi:hypothetical protein